MMKKSTVKKLISIILSVCMLVSTGVLFVNAEDSARFTVQYDTQTPPTYTDTETGERYRFMCEGVNSDGSEFTVVYHISPAENECFYKMLGNIQVKNLWIDAGVFGDYATPYYLISGDKIENIYDAYDKGMLEDLAFYYAMKNSENARQVKLIGSGTAPIFKDEFYKQYSTVSNHDDMRSYDELYIHRTDDEIDWALVYGERNVELPMTVTVELGELVINRSYWSVPFKIGYGIYDVSDEKFYDITEVWDSAKYNGLQETFTRIYSEANPSYRYKDVFLEKFYGEDYLRGADPYYEPLYAYDELYSHDGEDGGWTLIYAEGNVRTCAIVASWIFDRYFYVSEGLVPFELGYCVYDAAEDKFIGLYEAVKTDKYSAELKKYFDDNNIGRKLGDVNNDGLLTIADATAIQKYLAGIGAFPETDAVFLRRRGLPAYISDVNHDGERSISDATQIQKNIAQIAE